MLLIGTLGNLRNGQVYLDGEGIALTVDVNTDSGFAGEWDRYGLLANGSGYFCAARLR